MNSGQQPGTNFGQVIRQAREAAGLTLEALAERSGLGVRTISDIERGRTTRPRSATVSLLCWPLGLPVPDGIRAPAPPGIPASPLTADPAGGTSQVAAAQPGPDGAPRPAGRRRAWCHGDRRPPRPAGSRGRSSTGRIVPRQLPAWPRHFTGREAELGLLAGLGGVGGGRGASVWLIGGSAGVGKTALAVHAAHRAARQFPDGQLYVSLRGCGPAAPLHPAEAIRHVLDALDIPARRIPASLDAQAGLYRSVLAARRMLIVLDDAGTSGQVTPLLPGGSACSVIVTSRTGLSCLVAAHHAASVTLSPLPPPLALELLAARIGPGRLAAEPAAAADLAALSAGLPLAIGVIAARAITGPPRSLADLAAELRAVPGWPTAPTLCDDPWSPQLRINPSPAT
jgi:DNA-binding XRE family transcriptional regulator